MYVWARMVDVMKSATTTNRFAPAAAQPVAASLLITAVTPVIKMDGT
jgi:hypothetical protein